MATSLQEHNTISSPLKSIFSDFFELTKARLALSVVFSSLAGFLIAADEINFDVIFFNHKYLHTKCPK